MQLWSKAIKHNIYLTNNAYNMIKAHISFLSKVSIKAAIKLKQTFKKYIIILKYYPKLGKELNSKSKKPPSIKIRKMVIEKRYILLYFIVNNNIYIDAILDSRRNNKY